MMEIKNFTINGKCSSCGECCSGVLPMSTEEINRIKRYIKEHKIKEQRQHVMNGIDARCPFRDDKERRCTVYPVRPDICKQFMCNHTEKDIMEAKMDFHKHRDIVFMREKFYGNSELRNFMLSITNGGK